MNKYFYKKKVLITGHTGFKGSWLSLWMHFMGADVLGVSNGIVSKPSVFQILNLKKKIRSKMLDIRKYNDFKKTLNNFQPNYIFHLAAEAIVKKSFVSPYSTWSSNAFGTLNILESLRNYKKQVIVVIITSDKAYKNQEINRGYKETDVLGSLDPYSASKAAADLSTQSYINTYFKNKKNIKIAIARAGNVVGGGDWAENRLIPDCIRSWSKNQKVTIRNPKSTRPWQHVLDVLHGYILLSINLNKKKKINGEIFNFGPSLGKNNQVINVVKLMKSFWNKAKWQVVKKSNFYESKLLHLNSSKAKKMIKWKPVLDLNKTIFFTITWYKRYFEQRSNIYKFSIEQIHNFLSLVNIKNK